MPLYEYQCSQCGDEFEKMVRFSEMDKPVECPTCGSHEIQKAISVFASSGFSSTSSSTQSSSCNSRSPFR